MVRSWLAVLALAVLILAAACGGGGEDVSATPTGRPPDAGSPTPGPGEPTPFTADGQYEDPAQRYKVQIPEGWVPVPGIMSTATLTTDAFFAPDEGGLVRTNISVTCEHEDGTTLEQYVDLKRDLVEAVTGRKPEVEARAVSGREASGITYSLDRDPAVDKVEVYFADQDCFWAIALTVPSGRLEETRPLLDEFIASFQLLPQEATRSSSPPTVRDGCA